MTLAERAPGHKPSRLTGRFRASLHLIRAALLRTATF
jgi:hypothetical protein